MTPTLRPFQLEDVPMVDALHRAVDWPVRSRTGWVWLTDNPARPADFPIGWMAEDDAGRAAFVGQFPQRFWIGGEALTGVTGYSIIVPPTLRGVAGRLIRRIMSAPDVALFYTLNANALSAPLYARHGLEPWPDQTHRLKLAWVIDPAVCAAANLVRRLAPHRSGRPGPERLMNRRLSAPQPLRLPPQVTPLTDFGADWTLFWSRLKAEGRVLADRSAEVMRWRVAEPDATARPVMLAYRRDGAITGWLLAQTAKMNRLEPPVLDIIDLIALEDEPEALPALVRTLIANAARLGAAKVRLQVVTPALLAALGPVARRARREGGWGHGHVRFAPAHAGRLRAGWAPTPFDGDYSFCLRPPPRS